MDSIRFGKKSPSSADKKQLEKKSPAITLEHPPELTIPELERRRKALDDAFHERPHPRGNWINNPKGQFLYQMERWKRDLANQKLNLRMYQELLAGAQKYLPELSRKQAFGYLYSPEIIKDFFNTDENRWLPKLIAYSGPPVTKYFQTIAQKTANMKESDIRDEVRKGEQSLEKERQTLKDLQKRIDYLQREAEEKRAQNPRVKEFNKTEIEQLENQAKESSQKIEGIEDDLALRKLALPLKDAMRPLLDDVPPVPYKVIKPTIDATVADYNREHPGNQLVAVEPKAIGAGSMAQVHLGRLQNGQKVIVKVFRPEASAEYFAEYEKFVQFMMLFLLGNEQKRKAAQLAEGLMGIFKEEIRPDREKIHAERLQARFNAEGVPVRVPQVLSISDRGFVEEFVEGDNLIQLPEKAQQKALQTLAPALINSFLAYPERYLDPQGGNVKWPAAVFDFGRMAVLADETNEKILALEKAIIEERVAMIDAKARGGYSMPDKFKKIDTALKAFLPKDHKLSDHQLSSLAYQCAFGFSEGAMKGTTDDEISKQMLGQEKQMHISALFALMDTLTHEAEKGKISPLDSLKYEDVKHARSKLQALIRPYFDYDGDEFSDDSLLKGVSDLSVRQYLVLQQLKGYSGFSFWRGNGSQPKLEEPPAIRYTLARVLEEAQSSKRSYESAKTQQKDFPKRQSDVEKRLHEAQQEFNLIEGDDEDAKSDREQLQTRIKYIQEEREFLIKQHEEAVKSLDEKEETAKAARKQFQKTLRDLLASDEQAREYLIFLARTNKHLDVLSESMLKAIYRDDYAKLTDKKKEYAIALLKTELVQEFKPFSKQN